MQHSCNILAYSMEKQRASKLGPAVRRFLESASEYRPVFFERNKRFSVSVMTLRHFGLSLIKNQAQWQSLLQIYKHAEC